MEGSAAGVVNIGDVLAGKYRVESVLGEGGMGVVVAATHLHLDEKVAIKLLLPDAVRSPDIVSRFLQEGRAAVKIKSEHVARVIDVGTLESGAPYLVMEYLAGSDLADVIATGGPVSPDLAMEYVLQASEALAEAHALGIVHRDLKPANLFLTRRADGSPCVKVLDFGISKVTDGANHSKTKTSAVMGSPAYMSPEQMRSSRDVDGRSDIWALGAILYELLAGAPPFDADTVPQLCLMIMQDPLPPLSRVRLDVPPALEAAIRRCQEKDRENRFQHIGELAAALAPLVTGRARFSADRVLEIARASGLSARVSRDVTSRGVSTPPPLMTVASSPLNLGTAATIASEATPGATGSTSAVWSGSLEPRKKSGSAVAVVAAVVGAIVLVGGVLVVLVARRAPEPPQTSSVEATNPSAAAAGGPTRASTTGSAGVVASPAPVASDPPPSVTPNATGTAAQPAAHAVEPPIAPPQKPPALGPGKTSPTGKPTATPASKPPPKNPGGGLFDDRN
jgi:serine/threonine-protein kinase